MPSTLFQEAIDYSKFSVISPRTKVNQNKSIIAIYVNGSQASIYVDAGVNETRSITRYEITEALADKTTTTLISDFKRLVNQIVEDSKNAEQSEQFIVDNDLLETFNIRLAQCAPLLPNGADFSEAFTLINHPVNLGSAENSGCSIQ